MKKIINILIIGLIGLSCCGCNQYFTSEVTTGVESSEVYYGAYNRRDLTFADVVLYQRGSEKRCEGVVHLNAPSRSITLKNERTDAVMRLACTDGKLMNLSWQLKKGSFKDGYGEGIDQYNNTYRFKTVSKGQFKEVAGGKKKVIIPSKNSLLKH